MPTQVTLAPKNASQVIPRLWQGGKPAPGIYSFDVIVLVDDTYQPPATSFPGAEVVRVPLNDYRAATSAELESARQAALGLAQAYRAGQAILVTCGAGLNRSGLVTGLTMKMLGYSDAQLVQLIRAARGDRAIRNSGFLHYITTIGPVAPTVAESAHLVGPLALAGALISVGIFVGRRIAR